MTSRFPRMVLHHLCPWPLQVPGDSMQAEYVASYLTAALHDPDTTKVMHDCRRVRHERGRSLSARGLVHTAPTAAGCAGVPGGDTSSRHTRSPPCLHPQDSQLLAQQFGIQLAGVLDTQVLAGWAALGPAALGAGSGGTPGGGEAQQGAGLPEAAADAASAWVPVSRHLGRVGLGRLYAMHGFAHPSKEAMHAVFEADPRWAGRWGTWMRCGEAGQSRLPVSCCGNMLHATWSDGTVQYSCTKPLQGWFAART